MRRGRARRRGRERFPNFGIWSKGVRATRQPLIVTLRDQPIAKVVPFEEGGETGVKLGSRIGSLTLYRVYNGAKTKSFEVFGVARIKHLNCVADQGDGQNSVESPFRFKSARFEVVFESVPHLKFETATLTTGFLPVKINYFPSVRRSCRALKHRGVSKRTVELDKHLVGKNPLAGSSQKFRNNLLGLRVLRRIFVGSVDKNVRIQAVHDRDRAQRRSSRYSVSRRSSAEQRIFPPLKDGIRRCVLFGSGLRAKLSSTARRIISLTDLSCSRASRRNFAIVGSGKRI